MTALEGCLIVIGIVAIVISYFISEKNAEERMKKAVDELVLSEETKRTLIKQARDTVEETLNGMSDEISGKAEVQLEKLSNEKIMMVHDYSDTVLEEIGKNHHEVMFLYSMLDDKDKDVKHTVREAQKIVKTIHELKQVQEAAGQSGLQAEPYLEQAGNLEGNFGKNSEGDLNRGLYEKTDRTLEKEQKRSSDENRSKNSEKSLVKYQNIDGSGEQAAGDDSERERKRENRRNEKRQDRYLERMSERYSDRNQERMPDPYRERSLDRDQEKELEQYQERDLDRNQDRMSEQYQNGTIGKERYGKKRSARKRKKTETVSRVWKTEDMDIGYSVEAGEKREDFVRSESENKKRDTIIRLCEQGKSNLEIAKEMGLSMGEVKLMIDLYYVPEGSKGKIE